MLFTILVDSILTTEPDDYIKSPLSLITVPIIFQSSSKAKLELIVLIRIESFFTVLVYMVPILIFTSESSINIAIDESLKVF